MRLDNLTPEITLLNKANAVVNARLLRIQLDDVGAAWQGVGGDVLKDAKNTKIGARVDEVVEKMHEALANKPKSKRVQGFWTWWTS